LLKGVSYMRLVKKETGEACQKAFFDGYDFGETILEGVTFVVSVSNDVLTVDGVVQEDEDYFNRLNTEHWLSEAQRHVDSQKVEDLVFVDEFDNHVVVES
jgi:hypothetical protein